MRGLFVAAPVEPQLLGPQPVVGGGGGVGCERLCNVAGAHQVHDHGLWFRLGGLGLGLIDWWWVSSSRSAPQLSKIK